MSRKLPHWFKQEIPDDLILERLRMLYRFKVNTVCQEARCPNLSYCFKNLRFTFMILGTICTRNCRFCAVSKSADERLPLDYNEPYRISQIVKLFGLKYVVLTSVTRDDLSDAGAGIFAQTIELIHALDKNIKIEVLIPDFQGKVSRIQCLLDASPDVVAHSLETVKRLYRDLRPQADYQLSLDVLRKIKELKPLSTTKSSLILGLGETEQELIQTMKDLRESQCDILTLGQYLAPSIEHYPIIEFISPAQFQRYQDLGLALGFRSVLSGPKVRSSYRAEEVFTYA
jgi:lipoic acid synthetase